LDGAELKDDYSFSFNTPRLELQSEAPSSGFLWVKADDSFNLLFNQPVKDTDLEASASFEVEGWDRQIKAKVLKRVSIADERRAEADKARAEGRPYERLSDDARGFRNQQ